MITVVGIGPGDTNLLINAARQALSSADSVYGSKRQLQEIAELTT
ncbi:cobalt-precorrin-7 (C(5))-methyltransferase, partial [Listeria monocytogenes]